MKSHNPMVSTNKAVARIWSLPSQVNRQTSAIAAVTIAALALSLWLLVSGSSAPPPPNGNPSSNNGEGALAGLALLDPQSEPAQEGDGGEEGEEGEEAGPDLANTALAEVVVARVAIPVGSRLREELLEVQLRPSDNFAVRAGVTVGEIEDIVGAIVKTDVAAGQELLTPMIALAPTDLASMGSDLALHIDNGRVAIAIPINQYSGAAYAMRPGDFVDALMTFNLIELDIEFQSPLPNLIRVVNEPALERGEPFLFPAASQGRLELIPEIDQVAEVTPGGVNPVDIAEQGAEGSTTADTLTVEQIPRRTTQLTLQQLEVLWIGDWRNEALDGWRGPINFEYIDALSGANFDLSQLPAEEQTALLEAYGIELSNLEILLELTRARRQLISPDFVILSMPLQDALALKWAYEEPGVNIDLALRSQGDNTLFVTTSVSLPQLVEQAGLAIPEPGQFGLNPDIGEGAIPRPANRQDSDVTFIITQDEE